MDFLSYYTPMFKTSWKMFQDNKLIGQGPKLIDIIVIMKNL